MMIGLFAVPQVVNMINESQRMSNMGHSKRSIKIFATLKENAFGIVKWAITGVGIGALPGVGENIAAWAAYGMAKQSSKHPEEFGKGAVAGVMAPEVANNAAIAGAVLVLLVLGIPGSPPTAVLMGALQIHNIRPGPMLGVDFPNFLYDMGAWLFWASIMLLIIGILSARPLSMILRVPPRILAPLIGILCICGSYHRGQRRVPHSDRRYRRNRRIFSGKDRLPPGTAGPRLRARPADGSQLPPRPRPARRKCAGADRPADRADLLHRDGR